MKSNGTSSNRDARRRSEVDDSSYFLDEDVSARSSSTSNNNTRNCYHGVLHRHNGFITHNGKLCLNSKGLLYVPDAKGREYQATATGGSNSRISWGSVEKEQFRDSDHSFQINRAGSRHIHFFQMKEWQDYLQVKQNLTARLEEKRYRKPAAASNTNGAGARNKPALNITSTKTPPQSTNNTSCTKIPSLQEMMKMFDVIDKRVGEIEKQIGIDALFCLLPWRTIGKRSTTTQKDEEIGEMDREAIFKLPKDVYSILATWNWKSKPFWMSIIVVFGFQTALLVLLAKDRLSESSHANPLHLPVNVEAEVRIAQGLAVIVALVSQDDLRVGIEGFFQGVPDSFRGHQRFQGIKKLSWHLAYFLRFVQGFMSMFTSFILLMQADTVIDLCLNFLGVAFISDLDDRFFTLGALGYLGNANLRCTQEIARVEFYRDGTKHPTGRRCSPSWFRKSMHVLGVFAVLISMIGCYVHFTFQQRAGAYAVDNFVAEFGDETVPFLGIFDGCYNKDGNGGNAAAGRVVYSLVSKVGSKTRGGTFAFCPEMSRWTFYDSSTIVGDYKCEDYIVKSEDTRTFDVMEAGKLQWYTENDQPLEFLKLAFIGTCEGGKQSLVPADSCHELELEGVLPESRSRFYKRIEPPKQTDLLDPTLSHAIYIGSANSEVVLFTGRRWVIADATKLSSNPPTNIDLRNERDVQDFFFMDKLFNVKEQEKNWILLISEEVTSINDQGTPLGLRWYHPQHEGDFRYNFSSADLSRRDDAIFACARCDDSLNPCSYGGTCQMNGKCLCANGAGGELCREKPLGNGQCNPFFNKDVYAFDGGDCCGSTCEGGLCGNTSIFNPFGLESVTADPDVLNWYRSYETKMGIIAATDYVKKYDCLDPEMATFTIEISNLERSIYGAEQTSVGCAFGSVSVRCNGKLLLQTPALLFPDNSHHCNQSYVERVQVPPGSNCKLILVDRSETANLEFGYDVALHYGNSTNSTAIWQNQVLNGEVTWDVPASHCLTELLSSITLDVFNRSKAPGAAINRLSGDGLSDHQCTEDAGTVKERYFLTLLDQSVVFASAAWDLHQCQGWGFPAVRIECNENNTIISLIASSTLERPVGGTLPTEVSFLSHLEELDLGATNLLGPIPSELGKITTLSVLDLSDNDLTGPIPSELANLSALQYLDLGPNDLMSNVPSELGELTAMTNFGLSHNALNGSIPTELGNLQNAVFLELTGNDLTLAIPSELGKLTALTHLFLDSNILNGQIPTQLGNLTALTQLDLSHNDFSGPIPHELANLSMLDYLSLSSNDLTGSIPRELGLLTALSLLFLNSNQLNGPIPTQLGKPKHLKFLTLHKNALTGSIPEELGNLDGLRELSFAMNNLNGPVPSELGNLQGWPGLFPAPPFNGSNTVTINVRTDQYPDEISFEWSKFDESGLWQVVDTEDPAVSKAVDSYTKEVQSDTLYKLEIFDKYGDGILNGWITITNSTPSKNFNDGTIMWDFPGALLFHSAVVCVRVDPLGHAQVVEYIQGEIICT